MRLRLSPAAFSVAFCIGYPVLFLLNKPLFRYFPVPRQWAWGAADGVTRAGPALLWYGLIAGAALIAVAASIVVPDRWTMSSLRGWLWVWPYAAAMACLILLRVFFI